MKTANEFAKFAHNLRVLAEVMKPPANDRYAGSRSLIQYHLNRAAAKSQEIAEEIAKDEPRSAA
jgi:hypothetical protein